MANRYNSNIRTYSAKNLLWRYITSPSPDYGLYVVNNATYMSFADNPIAQNCVLQFYNAQRFKAQPLSFWNSNSNISIKRCGIFSNFADGLVLENEISRLGLLIGAARFMITPLAGTVDFTIGSPVAVFTGASAPVVSYISDNSSFTGANAGNVYWIRKITDKLDGTWDLLLSDFSYRTIHNSSLYSMIPADNKTFSVSGLSVLNTMFETEIFMNISAQAANEILLPFCKLEVNGTASGAFKMYLSTIDDAFNGKPLTFDSIAEMEITPV